MVGQNDLAATHSGVFFFLFIWLLWAGYVKIISLFLSQVNRKVGRKEKTPDHSQAELGLSHMWPEPGEMKSDLER